MTVNDRPYPELNRNSIKEVRRALDTIYWIDPEYWKANKSLRLEKLPYVSEHFSSLGKQAEVYFLRTDELDIRSYKGNGAATVILEAMGEGHRHNQSVKANIKEGELIKKIKIIADSEGNHAQGVAKAVAAWNKFIKISRFLKAFGINFEPSITANIFMSGNADQTKVDKTKELGGDNAIVTIAEGKAYDVARIGAKKEFIRLTEEAVEPDTKVVYVPPFNHPNTAKGAGTLGIDIDEKLGTSADLVVCGLGGGGLTSGLLRYYENTGTKLITVGTSLHPAVIAGLINNGEEINLRNTDRELSKIHVGGATIIRGGDITLKILKDAEIRIETAHPEQLAWLLNEYIEKELGYKSFAEYRAARESGAETRKTPELAGLQSLAYLRNNPEVLDGKQNVVSIISGGNISLEGSEVDINESLNIKGHKKYPSHLPTAFYDPKDLVGSLKSLINIVDDRNELDNIEKNWVLKDDTFYEKNSSNKKVKLTKGDLQNTLFILTGKVIERIGSEVRLVRDQAHQKNMLKGLINDWAGEGRFNEEEKEQLLDKLKPQINRKKDVA